MAKICSAQSEADRRSRVLLRMETRQALREAVTTWLASRGLDPCSDKIHAYLKRWDFEQEQDQFELQPPSRWGLFRHRWNDARLYRRLRSPRHRLVTYVNALGVLFLGYEHRDTLETARKKMMAKLIGRKS